MLTPHIGYICERELLNGPDSTKATYHIRLKFAEPLAYQPGDTIAIRPMNHPDDVQHILSHIPHAPDTPILHPRTQQPTSLETFLTAHANLFRVSKNLRQYLQLPEQQKYPDVATALQTSPHVDHLTPFVESLSPLLPRYYSIASSPKVVSDGVDLLVATFTFSEDGVTRKGLGSDFLCHRADFNTPISFALQPTTHFTLPDDHNTPIIMIGPGTGIAPFRAFLQHRPQSPNWLIFGERQKNQDFYYRDFLEALQEKHNLCLHTAFSRDQAEKEYVQQRLMENQEQIWDWLEHGAIIYICGDAKRMAKDVTQTLMDIFTKYTPDPQEYLKTLRRNKRLRLDVY